MEPISSLEDELWYCILQMNTYYRIWNSDSCEEISVHMNVKFALEEITEEIYYRLARYRLGFSLKFHWFFSLQRQVCLIKFVFLVIIVWYQSNVSFKRITVR